jgi:glyoxylase-like metal-dependent hydrolase (beta-lactamase superfamily II)
VHDGLLRWTVGDVRVTCVVETSLDDFTAPSLGWDAASLARCRDWAVGPYLGPDDLLRMSVQSFCLEADGMRVIVDTCVGNGRHLPEVPSFHHLDTPFLERLAAAGFAPGEIDLVVCTHLHVDHIGWNTVRDPERPERWLPTFPRARYLMTQADVDHWRGQSSPYSTFDTSVAPLLEARRVEATALEHAISPSLSLWPSPGHTPGHVSVRIASRGETAFITGDMVHSPLELALPTHEVRGDSDPAEATRSRLRMVSAVGGRDVLVLGTHFPAPTGGYLLRHESGWRFGTA